MLISTTIIQSLIVYCEAVQSAILATAWLLVYIVLPSLPLGCYCETGIILASESAHIGKHWKVRLIPTVKPPGYTATDLRTPIISNFWSSFTHYLFRLVAKQSNKHRYNAELLEGGDVGSTQWQLPDGASGGQQHFRVTLRVVDYVDQWNETAVLSYHFTDGRVFSALHQRQHTPMSCRI